MGHKPYFVVSGVIFGVVTIAQLVKLILQIPVQVGAFNVPMWPSVIGLIVALSMCIWVIRLALR
jgi:hypothetical protein